MLRIIRLILAEGMAKVSSLAKTAEAHNEMFEAC